MMGRPPKYAFEKKLADLIDTLIWSIRKLTRVLADAEVRFVYWLTKPDKKMSDVLLTISIILFLAAIVWQRKGF